MDVISRDYHLSVTQCRMPQTTEDVRGLQRARSQARPSCHRYGIDSQRVAFRSIKVHATRPFKSHKISLHPDQRIETKGRALPWQSHGSIISCTRGACSSLRRSVCRPPLFARDVAHDLDRHQDGIILREPVRVRVHLARLEDAALRHLHCHTRTHAWRTARRDE